MNIRLTIAAVCALTLAGCLNDGTVADQHVITFEKPLPASHPSHGTLESATRTWVNNTFPDGGSVKNLSIGPVRYARILIPFPDTDFFTCAQFTAKNQYGTYMPPIQTLLTYRNYNDGRGFVVALAKEPGAGAYDQYCISQPHNQ